MTDPANPSIYLSDLSDAIVEQNYPGSDPELVREQFRAMMCSISDQRSDNIAGCVMCDATIRSTNRIGHARKFCGSKCRSAYHTACGRIGDYLVQAGLASHQAVRRFAAHDHEPQIAVIDAVDALQGGEVEPCQGKDQK